MDNGAGRRSAAIAWALLLLALVLAVIAVLGADGWLGGLPTVLAIFFGPGVGWQNARGRLRFNPEAIGLAVATSIGCVIVLGLAMNAVELSLTRAHWSAVLAILLAALGMRGLVGRRRDDIPHTRPAVPARRRAMAVALTATCVVAVTGSALIAWFSQQHWLARQHYTELYATGSSELQRVTVTNHEGEAIGYRARIAVAGQAAQVVSFTLNDGSTWSRVVAVDPARATADVPMLEVELVRIGVPGVYRYIRLVRPQPTAQPTF